MAVELLLISSERPQVLGYIILHLVVSFFIMNFHMHGEKIRNPSQDVTMGVVKRVLVLNQLIQHHTRVAPTLNDYVVHDNTNIHEPSHLI